MKYLIPLAIISIFLAACQPVEEEEVIIELSFKSDFAPAWERSKIYTLALADSMPEELYSYKPSKDVFSFGKQLTHCIDFATGQLVGNGLANESPFKGRDWESHSKAEIRAALAEMYAWVDSLSEALPDSVLEKEIDYFGQTAPAWRVIEAIENHTIHHRGQALVYMRMNGITPPGYAGW
ncbi:MAG: DinB family protein [Bacteroidia bacterium]|nr:DinB family protein [Bacteroidia bacterium]